MQTSSSNDKMICFVLNEAPYKWSLLMLDKVHTATVWRCCKATDSEGLEGWQLLRKEKHTGKLHISITYSLNVISTLWSKEKELQQNEVIPLAEEREVEVWCEVAATWGTTLRSRNGRERE